jgi:hypothetical protein
MSTVSANQLLLAIACLIGCSSNVQDLGRAPPAPEAERDPRVAGGLEGNPALMPPVRTHSCPLSRPIEGDECGLENGAPCTFVGGPEASPDLPATPIAVTTTFCVCTAEKRWSCLQGVTIKTLDSPLVDGDACESGLSIERDGATCTCLEGVARCR